MAPNKLAAAKEPSGSGYRESTKREPAPSGKVVSLAAAESLTKAARHEQGPTSTNAEANAKARALAVRHTSAPHAAAASAKPTNKKAVQRDKPHRHQSRNKTADVASNPHASSRAQP
jgi:hypothetical protein